MTGTWVERTTRSCSKLSAVTGAARATGAPETASSFARSRASAASFTAPRSTARAAKRLGEESAGPAGRGEVMPSTLTRTTVAARDRCSPSGPAPRMPVPSVFGTTVAVGPGDDMGDPRRDVLVTPRADVELHRGAGTHVTDEPVLPRSPGRTGFAAGSPVGRAIAGQFGPSAWRRGGSSVVTWHGIRRVGARWSPRRASPGSPG